MEAICGIENAVATHAAAMRDLCAKIVELMDRRRTTSNRSDQFKRYGVEAGAIRQALDERTNTLDTLVKSSDEEPFSYQCLQAKLRKLLIVVDTVIASMEVAAAAESDPSVHYLYLRVVDYFRNLHWPRVKRKEPAVPFCDPHIGKVSLVDRRERFPSKRPIAKCLARPKRQITEYSVPSMSSLVVPMIKREDDILWSSKKSELLRFWDAIVRDQQKVDQKLREQKEVGEKLERLRETLACLRAAEADEYAVPSYWCTYRLYRKRCYASFMRVEITHSLSDFILNILRTKSCGLCHGRLDVMSCLKIERVENTYLWKAYCRMRDHVAEWHKLNEDAIRPIVPSVDGGLIHSTTMVRGDVNETYLLHGVRDGGTAADIICRYGFDPRIAKLEGLYGAGTYFADQACKALQYAYPDASGRRYIFFCRVTMGQAFASRTMMQRQRRPPHGYDSVVANTSVANFGMQIHREFIIYDGSQIYPEFLISFGNR